MAIETPTYPQFTNIKLKEGLFDQLMATVKHHIQEEYDQNRIRGDQYAKVYLGSMESVMQNTTQYLLGIMLIDEQQGKLSAETSLILAQESKIEAEIRKIEAEIAVLELQDDLIAAQILKINAEIAYLEAQETFMLKQADKIDQEIIFLQAKTQTERANVESGIADLDSVVGKQKTLLTAQRYGFAGDIENKIAKLHADYAAIWQGVQEDETVPTLYALPADAGPEDSTTTYDAVQLAAQTAAIIKNLDII